MNAILTEQISNHPVFSSVERHVDVVLQQANATLKTFNFHFVVRYILDDVDITSTISQPSNDRIGTDATTKQLIRDTITGEPIPNPDFNPDDFSEENPPTEYDIYLWMYGWNLITMLINQPTNIAEIIRQYIKINDYYKFFDT